MNRSSPIRRVRAFWPMMSVFAVLALGYALAIAQTGSSDRTRLARGAGTALANLVMDNPLLTLGGLVLLVGWVLVHSHLTRSSARSRRS
jgi:hypothetical protein